MGRTVCVSYFCPSLQLCLELWLYQHWCPMIAGGAVVAVAGKRYIVAGVLDVEHCFVSALGLGLRLGLGLWSGLECIP